MPETDQYLTREWERMRQESGITKWHEDIFGVMDMFTTFIVVMVSWVYTPVKFNNLYTKTCAFIVCQLNFNKAVNFKIKKFKCSFFLKKKFFLTCPQSQAQIKLPTR